MNFALSSIAADRVFAAARLIVISAGALFLVAGDLPGSHADTDLGPDVAYAPGISDDLLAPLPAAEAAAATAALTATTPPDVAAAARRAPAALPTVERFADAPVIAPADAPAIASAREGAKVRPASLNRMVATMADADDDVARDAELRCLANAVYFEARGEPLEGQLAVAQAILNRVESGRYARTVCGVIAQPRQFSFDKSRTPRAGRDWDTAQAIAAIAMRDLWEEVAPKALSFHATYVSPGWTGKTRVAQIGRHIFYR